MGLEFPYFIDAPVRSAVDLHDIEARRRSAGNAAGAFPAGFGPGSYVRAIESLGEDPRQGGLSATPGSRKKVGVDSLASLESVPQDRDRCVLAYDLPKL